MQIKDKLWLPTIQHDFIRETKNIHREGIRIYLGTFRTSQIKALHV